MPGVTGGYREHGGGVYAVDRGAGEPPAASRMTVEDRGLGQLAGPQDPREYPGPAVERPRAEGPLNELRPQDQGEPVRGADGRH